MVCSLPSRDRLAPVTLKLMLLVSAMVGAMSTAGGQAHASYFAAAGAVTINPPSGTWMAGYGLNRASTGVLDDLWAKTLILSDGTHDLAIVSIDNIGLTDTDIAPVRAAIRAALPSVRVVVSSTHTHAGPDVVGLWGPERWRSGRDEVYMARLRLDLVTLVIETHAHLQPVTLHAGSARVPRAWVENVSEPGLLDDTLAVLEARTADGKTLATLTNYACHPTVLGPDNTRVSADYVGGFYARMHRERAGEHLFLQGSIGGWVQPIQGDRSSALAQAHGADLADAALGVRVRPVPEQPIWYREQTVTFELDNWGFRLMAWLGVLEREIGWGDMHAPVSAWRIGDVVFVTHPGETSPAYALASRDLMQGRTEFVLGLAQDALGYILKPGYFDDDAPWPHAAYLTSVSTGRSAGPRLMAVLEALLAEDPGPTRPGN